MILDYILKLIDHAFYTFLQGFVIKYGLCDVLLHFQHLINTTKRFDIKVKRGEC